MKFWKNMLCALMSGCLLFNPVVAEGFSYGNFPSYSYNNIGYVDEFKNFVDGYSIQVPTGMTVDMSKSEIVTTLHKNDLKLEIYNQEIKSDSSAQSYINYGNNFIKNTRDHRKEYEADVVIKGKNSHVLQWSREKLSRIENDYNYYATVDMIIDSKNVTTLFFKSTKPLYETVDYMAVANSYNVLEKTVAPSKMKTTVVGNKGWNEKTQEFFNRNFLQSTELQWGMFEPFFPSTDKLKSIEASIGSNLDYVVLYTHVKDNDLTHIETALEVAKNEGRTIELTLQTRGSLPGEKNPVYGILDGDYDTYLYTYATQIAEYGEPILFRLGNEMNGDWCSYSSYHTSKDADIFKAMYKYIYGIFEEVGANKNAIWVWNPNGRSYPDFDWNSELMYYPGDEYVDVVGMTAYNTGTYYEAEKWTSFVDLYDNLYKTYAQRYAQPLMITEFASSSVGGDKVQWVKDMFNALPNYPRLKLAIWWNGADYDAQGKVARPYFIDDIPGVIEVFRENLSK